MPVSSAERRAYNRAMRALVERLGRVDAETIRREVALLRELRNRISGELLAGGSDWTLYQGRQLRANLERMIAELESQLIQETGGAVAQAWELGGRAAVEPLNEVGFGGVFFQPTLAQVNILVDFSADLIRGITAEALAKINRELRLAGLGHRNPYETMQAITQILGLKGRALTGVAYRAEMITRTESLRAYNMANQAQIGRIAGTLPETRKRWIHSGKPKPRIDHIMMHERTYREPIPWDQPYVFSDGSQLMQPHDPAGPAHQVINCGCTQCPVVADFGVIGSPLDEATIDLAELIRANGGKLP